MTYLIIDDYEVYQSLDEGLLGKRSPIYYRACRKGGVFLFWEIPTQRLALLIPFIAMVLLQMNPQRGVTGGVLVLVVVFNLFSFCNSSPVKFD